MEKEFPNLRNWDMRLYRPHIEVGKLFPQREMSTLSGLISIRSSIAPAHSTFQKLEAGLVSILNISDISMGY